MRNKYLWFANKVSAKIDKQAKQRIFTRKKNATNIKKARKKDFLKAAIHEI